MEKRIKWHVEKRELSALKPYDKNPRIITELGLDQIKESFDEIGVAQPINVNLDNTILSGHARYYQLKAENPNQSVDVYVPDRKLTPRQEEAVIIRLNKTVAGQWDFDVLANQFEIPDLRLWGFTDRELKIDVEIKSENDTLTNKTEYKDMVDHIEGFLDADTRKISFILSKDEYEHYTKSFENLKKDMDTQDSSQIFMHILRHYESGKN